MDAAPILLTAGYEGRTPEGLLQDLRVAAVECLIDVRELPLSRKPGFSKVALRATLAEVGIGYRHVRALGCPRPIRNAYRQHRDWDRYTQDYLQHLAGQTAAVEALSVLSQRQRLALLCFEADFTRCHRTLVAHAISASHPRTILHVTPAGLCAEAVPGRC